MLLLHQILKKNIFLCIARLCYCHHTSNNSWCYCSIQGCNAVHWVQLMTILNSVCTNRTIYRNNNGTQYELLYQKHKCKYHKHPIKWSQCNAMHDNNIWCCQSCNCSPNPFGDKANFQRLKPMFFQAYFKVKSLCFNTKKK